MLDLSPVTASQDLRIAAKLALICQESKKWVVAPPTRMIAKAKMNAKAKADATAETTVARAKILAKVKADVRQKNLLNN